MATGNVSANQAKARAEEMEQSRLRLRAAAPPPIVPFVVPLVFFVLSFALASIQGAGVISEPVHWAGFFLLAVFAFAGTLFVLDGRSVIKRGNRLSAPTLVLYLVAIRSVLFVNDRSGVAASVAIFVVTMVLLAAYAQWLRKSERPAPSKQYTDLMAGGTLRPLLVTLSEVDRIDEAALERIAEMKDKPYRTAIEKFEKAGYVTAVERRGGERALIPTTFLRRSVRSYQRVAEEALSNARPGWLAKRKSR